MLKQQLQVLLQALGTQMHSRPRHRLAWERRRSEAEARRSGTADSHLLPHQTLAVGT